MDYLVFHQILQDYSCLRVSAFIVYSAVLPRKKHNFFLFYKILLKCYDLKMVSPEIRSQLYPYRALILSVLYFFPALTISNMLYNLPLKL